MIDKDPSAIAAAALDGIDDGVLVVDRQGKVRFWNRALERLTGSSAASAAGMSMAALLPLPEEDGRTLLEAAQHGSSAALKASEIGLHGARRYFDVNVRAIDGSGSVVSLREVTAEVHVAEQLLESENRFRAMADSAPVLLWMAGTDTKCHFFNDTWLRFTGRPIERELGVGWAEGVHPEDFADCLETYMEAFSQRRPFRMEYRLRRHDGEYRWLLDTGVPRSAPEGPFMGYIGSCIDITELRESRAGLERSLREKEVLLREVHHRVKNNLQVVTSLMRLAEERAEGGPAAALFRESRNRIRSIALAHEALYSSPDATRVDFDGYLRQMASSLFASYNGDAEGVTMRFDTQALRLPLDVAVPCGLLLNELISNALKHAYPAERAGTIEVGLRRDGARVRLWVHDDGVGLLPGPRPDASKGLGIVRALTSQITGQLVIAVEDGTRVAVEFDAPAGSLDD